MRDIGSAEVVIILLIVVPVVAYTSVKIGRWLHKASKYLDNIPDPPARRPPPN